MTWGEQLLCGVMTWSYIQIQNFSDKDAQRVGQKHLAPCQPTEFFPLLNHTPSQGQQLSLPTHHNLTEALFSFTEESNILTELPWDKVLFSSLRTPSIDSFLLWWPLKPQLFCPPGACLLLHENPGPTKSQRPSFNILNWNDWGLSLTPASLPHVMRTVVLKCWCAYSCQNKIELCLINMT